MLRNATDQLVIKPRLSSTTRLLIAVAAVVVVAAASLAGYLGGRDAVQMQLDSRAREIDRLHEALQQSREQRASLDTELEAARGKLEAAGDKLEEMRHKLDETRSNLTKVTRQLQIDQTAYRELRQQLQESNEQITRLGSELKFYRSIISPSDGESGVKVQELRLDPTGAARQYRYRLTLIQALDHEKPVSGVVRFEIEGSQQDSSRTLSIPGEGDDVISAEFKYFRNLGGTFTLPEGFVPTGIKVIFEREAGGAVERDYPWPMDETSRDL